MQSGVPMSANGSDDVNGFAAVPGAGSLWQVHKFGGTSLATSECYRNCADIVLAEVGVGD